MKDNAVTSITEHEGNKYLRWIISAVDPVQVMQVDVYAVLVAFNITCPARQHAIKKLLCAGLRGKGDEQSDLVGAVAAIYRAIEIHNNTHRENKRTEPKRG